MADYSQIELRLLAHMSGDALLVEAFRNGEDIHTRTASEVLGVPPLMVTPEARRDAKAVNFGIVYGISAFGLAAQLGISRAEAEKYIRNYFARYSGVRRFIDETIAEVRRTGVTRTLFGRERPIPDINSRNPNARGFAERTAVNSPLAGHRRGPDQAGHGAHRRRARSRRLPEPPCCCRCTTNWCSNARRRRWTALPDLVKREMEGVCELNGAADGGYGDGRQLAGREVACR